MSDTESNKENQVYELSYLLLPSIPEENLSEVVSKIEKVIEDKGGKKIDGENPFLRELAYEMSKVVGASRYVVKNAYVGWVKFELPTLEDAEQHPVEEIKELVEKMEEVLRFLLVKAERETKFTFASTMKPAESEEIPEEVLEVDDSEVEDELTDDEIEADDSDESSV